MKKIFIMSFGLFIFVFFISCITTYVSYSNSNFTTSKTIYFSQDEEFVWPLPDYTTISSYFGERTAPTTGASSFHSGIDIPAPEGTEIFSSCSGIVIFQEYNGSNGYTIKIQNNNTIFSYSHISPNYIVNIGDTIKKGQHIANVGPKYITTETGVHSNGATTGCHLHFSIILNGKLTNPLTVFPKIENY